jgi:uncharacterized protein (DUF305 family)
MLASIRAGLRRATAVCVVVLVAACGEDENAAAPAPAPTEAPRVSGNGIDRGFVTEMVPHHESAVEMAQIAEQRAERPQIRRLSEAIISTQNTEIRQMQGLDQQLADAGIERRRLGLDAHAMGMHMDPSLLRGAQPFDRAFLDMMIPHHEGAIRMAQRQLERGRNRTVKRLARSIVRAQTKEINQMHNWRIQWFGISLGHEHH